MPDRSCTALLLTAFTAATLGASSGSAQALASRDTFAGDTAPKMTEAALLPGPISKTPLGVQNQASITDLPASRFELGATTIVALIVTAFWLTVVGHVFGSPSPPRRRKP